MSWIGEVVGFDQQKHSYTDFSRPVAFLGSHQIYVSSYWVICIIINA